MSKKMHILVPTDFSNASRAGVRFAIQWSRQQNVHLIFVHVLQLVRLTRWSDRQYEDFTAQQRTLHENKLAAFVADVERRLPLRKGTWSASVLEGISADIALMEYCRDHPEIGLVCMGTKGAGVTRRLFGTNTGNMILHAETPVIAVPAGYRRKRIASFVYATDLNNSSGELRQVAAFVKPLHAKLLALHLRETGDMALDTMMLQKLWKKEVRYPVTVAFKERNDSFSIAKNLESAARSLHPSVLALFSNRRRTVFQSLFYPSNAERLALNARIPLLVLGKQEHGH